MTSNPYPGVAASAAAESSSETPGLGVTPTWTVDDLGAGTAGRVLLVDDDPTLLRAIARALRGKGYQVLTADNGEEAVEQVNRHEFDAILSDITMPNMDGIQLLREVREHDLSVPVVLITGDPAVSTAVKAVEYGAFHYLTKPTSIDDISAVLGKAVGLSRMARVKQQAAELLGTAQFQVADRAGLEAAFDRTIQGLWIAYQPIVRARDHSIFGYEALVRSEEPALPNPGALLSAAEKLDSLQVLGRTIRGLAAAPLRARERDDRLLFVNCHPRDILDDALYDRAAPLSAMADRVVLEITERSSLEELGDVRGRVAALRDLGYRIALDDFGAGYAGLTSFAKLEPEIIKLDLSIVREVNQSSTKQKVIRSMSSLAKEMHILVVAEGVESIEERNCLLDLGVDLLQGFYFARPGRPFPSLSEEVRVSGVHPTAAHPARP